MTYRELWTRINRLSVEASLAVIHDDDMAQVPQRGHFHQVLIELAKEIEKGTKSTSDGLEREM